MALIENYNTSKSNNNNNNTATNQLFIIRYRPNEQYKLFANGCASDTIYTG